MSKTLSIPIHQSITLPDNWQACRTPQELSYWLIARLYELQTEVDELESTVETDVSGLRSDLTTLESTVSGIGYELASVTNRVTATEGDVTALTARVTSAEDAIIAVNSALETIDQDITDLQDDVSFLMNTVSNHGTQITTLEAHMVTANPDMTGQTPTTLTGVKIGDSYFITGGGNKPQLFPPATLSGYNTVKWSKGLLNGGYNVNLSASIDGSPVTSPLSIDSTLNGKTLKIDATLDGATANVLNDTLAYVAGNYSFSRINMENKTTDKPRDYTIAVGFSQMSGDADIYYNGSTYGQTWMRFTTRGVTRSNYYNAYITALSSSTVNLKRVVYTATYSDGIITTSPVDSQSQYFEAETKTVCRYTVYDITDGSIMIDRSELLTGGARQTIIDNFKLTSGHTYIMTIDAICYDNDILTF